ncbi:MAG: TolC family protein [Phycisphaerae bacterium]
MGRLRTAVVVVSSVGICAGLVHATDSVSSATAPSTSATIGQSSSGGSGGEDRSSSKEEEGVSIPPDRLDWHLPDPQGHRVSVEAQLHDAERAGDRASIESITRVLKRVGAIHRPRQMSLSLQDALHRALKNSFAIAVASYNPAVETTRVVEAEAAFDALFFANVIKNIQDQPPESQLVTAHRDSFSLESGVRKLLPVGTQVSASFALTRSKTSSRFATQFGQVNPQYTSNIILEMRQPLLRGFGIDQNRSLIVIADNDRQVSELAFRRQVRDTLRKVEVSYWNLVQARRDVVVAARLLAGFETIYAYLEARKDFDVIPVQLAATKADLERSHADFVRSCANVFDAEDTLIAAINAADIDLADDTEIVPTDFPILDRIVVDRLAEAQTALDNRPEIKESELAVANARVAAVRAKNAELPKFDLTFRYTIDGLAGTADKAFDEVSRHKYTEYFVGVELEIPIGNRGPRAVHHRARLQHLQAIAALKAKFEEVILDVNLAVRKLGSTFDEIGPLYESVEASEREVSSIVARAERMDINTLRNELNARQNLAAVRRSLLGTVVDYNVAIIELERATGTLLQHYNIAIAPAAD